jgi:hypothetical protein
VVLDRLGVSTAGVGGPTLSYLVWSGGGDAATRELEPEPQTTPNPRTDPTPVSPVRRRAPDRESGTILRTVVRELVHVREPPLTIRERRAGVEPGAGATASAAPTIDRPSTVAGVPGPDMGATAPDTGDTAPANVERTVVRHGGWTAAVDRVPTGAWTTSDAPAASTRASTSPDDLEPLSLRRETTTTTTPRGPLAGPTDVERGRRGSTARPRLTVAADTGTRSDGELSWSAGRGQASDAFGPPTELTVRRAGGSTDGAGRGTGRARTAGTTTQSIDLTDLGGASGRASGADPSPPTPNSQAPSPTSSLDLSGAPRAEVDRFVDRLYGELSRRHRIERERRGR